MRDYTAAQRRIILNSIDEQPLRRCSTLDRLSKLGPRQLPTDPTGHGGEGDEVVRLTRRGRGRIELHVSVTYGTISSQLDFVHFRVT